MKNINRVILIVLDSVGIGEMPDAHLFGDEGSNTVGNIAKQYPALSLPNLVNLGLGNIVDLGIGSTSSPQAAFGRGSEASPGKDTTTGHWEISGVILKQPFPTFPHGFPPEILEPFEKTIGRKTLANKPASGTVIIEEYGEEHQKTGSPIVYTSADSVFQVAMHEDVIPIEEQYRICQIARDMLVGENAVGRVIARPFIGEARNYQRTIRRKDFSLIPRGATVLNQILAGNQEVMAVGKINDIFAEDGVSQYVKTANNMEGVDRTLEYMHKKDKGLIFTNLVDFDMHFGHRNNVPGYANALMEFDQRIPELLANMRDEDVMIITADHGCDPTTPNTDHSREYIPILCVGKQIKKGQNIGTRTSFADIGASISELLGVDAPQDGQSFAKEICAN